MKRNRNKITTFFGGMMLFLLMSLSMKAQQATAILDKAISAYEKSNGIRAAFTIQTRSEAERVSERSDGTISIRDDKFVLKTSDFSIWFDGTTQWTYMERNSEVNVSTPDEEELLMTNPIFLLKAYKKGFTARYKGESTAFSGKTAQDIELVPKKKGDIVQVELQIEKSSGLPASIQVLTRNGMRSVIRVHKMETGINQPDRFFVFDKNEYPDVEVIDLR